MLAYEMLKFLVFMVADVSHYVAFLISLVTASIKPTEEPSIPSLGFPVLDLVLYVGASTILIKGRFYESAMIIKLVHILKSSLLTAHLNIVA